MASQGALHGLLLQKPRVTTSLLTDRATSILRDRSPHSSAVGFGRLRNHKRVSIKSARKQGLHVMTAAAEGDSFSHRSWQFAAGLSKTLSEGASDLFDSAKDRASKFGQDVDFSGKAKQFIADAGDKYEEINFDIRRKGARLNSQYKISEKAKHFAASVVDRAETVDEKLGIKRKLRAMSMDIGLKAPTYRRRLRLFLDSPGGQLLGVCFLAWFFLSGWFFRILVWSFWIVPLVPLLVRLFVKAAFVQGACDVCGLPYTGIKSSVVTCTRCRQIVWQPGQTLDKDSPTIIDIEAK